MAILSFAASLMLLVPRTTAQCTGSDADPYACSSATGNGISSDQYSGEYTQYSNQYTDGSQPGADQSMPQGNMPEGNGISEPGYLQSNGPYQTNQPNSAINPNLPSIPNRAGNSPGLNRNQQRRGTNPYGSSLRIYAPPPPPTEFQRFVAASTGQMLPIYGARFFTTFPATFRPLDNGPAPAATILGPGDELRVRIWGQINFSGNLLVSREGEIYLPKVGAIRVAGLPFSDVRDHLRAAISHVYRNFDLSVDLGEIHTIQIYVTGFARRPGDYTVSALSTLVDAVFECGGPDPSGSLRHVELKRAGKVIADFDLYDLLIRGDKTGDAQLHPGDVLYIPPVGPQVALLGSVGKTAIYELRGTESLGELLMAAGGRTAVASGNKISIDRIIDREQRQGFSVSPSPTGLATVLTDGDIVRIDPIISNYEDTVTLRGAVANPGHFRWHPGMRLSDLLPDRDALLKRDYWWRRTQLGLPAPEFVMQQHLPVLNSRYQPNTPYSQNEPYSPSAPYSGNELNSPNAPRTSNSATISAAAASQASAYDPIPRRAPIQSAGGDSTDWNEAMIERFNHATMTTSLIPFALGKLVLDRDTSQDLALQPGDVITIFSQSDIEVPVREQTKYVTLEGEFVHPGVYSVLPGETLRALVKRIGGLTPQAYLYAAVFTRRSTLQLEQLRLNQFAAQLEYDLIRNVPAQSSGTDPAILRQQQAANREVIARLRSVRATGRLVLDLRRRANGTYELPNMQLEDGDRFIVPSEPATVQVVGAVFNPHAFRYERHGSEKAYLQMAGGPTRDADRRHIYILRADGSVALGGEGYGTIFSHGAGNIHLQPGDSVIVPEKQLRAPANVNQILTWSQMIAQTAMSGITTAAVMNY